MLDQTINLVLHLELPYEPPIYLSYLTIYLLNYLVNKKVRNPSPTKVAISTRPLRQYYDTENYQRLQPDFE